MRRVVEVGGDLHRHLAAGPQRLRPPRQHRRVVGQPVQRGVGGHDAAAYERFLAVYRARLLDEIGDRRPYFYAFKRILIWGRAGL